jgi:hypothetical protein
VKGADGTAVPPGRGSRGHGRGDRAHRPVALSPREPGRHAPSAACALLPTGRDDEPDGIARAPAVRHRPRSLRRRHPRCHEVRPHPLPLPSPGEVGGQQVQIWLPVSPYTGPGAHGPDHLRSTGAGLTVAGRRYSLDGASMVSVSIEPDAPAGCGSPASAAPRARRCPARSHGRVGPHRPEASPRHNRWGSPRRGTLGPRSRVGRVDHSRLSRRLTDASRRQHRHGSG